MYCDLWSQYIQVQKLFKGVNYSRAETICGNMMYYFSLSHSAWWTLWTGNNFSPIDFGPLLFDPGIKLSSVIFHHFWPSRPKGCLRVKLKPCLPKLPGLTKNCQFLQQSLKILQFYSKTLFKPMEGQKWWKITLLKVWSPDWANIYSAKVVSWQRCFQSEVGTGRKYFLEQSIHHAEIFFGPKYTPGQTECEPFLQYNT